jgi:lysine 2,3-aminomutase
MNGIKRLTHLKQVAGLTTSELHQLEPVANRFVFRSNTYYEGLINWNDPDDPIRRLIVPVVQELEDDGSLDASGEATYTVVPGLQHKYRDTALLLVNDVCAAYCRFCFRKRLFLDDNDEVVKDVSGGVEYIRAHPEISNVLLSGGDPLVMSTNKLRSIVDPISSISHVKIIRIGTKVPAFEPQRVLADSSLPDLLREYGCGGRRIYIMAHFTHPRELTSEAIACMEALQRVGAITVNQAPLIAGINDDPVVLAELFNRLSFIGVSPYYIFQCRPTLGNKAYSLPLEHAYRIFSSAQGRASGLAKRARFVMSHLTGKIEVLGIANGFIYMKYHQIPQSAPEGQLMVYRSDENAHWFDDYASPARSGSENLPLERWQDRAAHQASGR